MNVSQILNSVCDWFAQDKSVRYRRPTGRRTPPIWRLRPWCSIPRPLISTKKSDLRYISISLHLYLYFSNITNDNFFFLTGATKPWALFGPWNLHNLKASQMELDFWTEFIWGPLIKILHIDETAVNCWTESFIMIPYEPSHTYDPEADKGFSILHWITKRGDSMKWNETNGRTSYWNEMNSFWHSQDDILWVPWFFHVV